MSNLFQGCYLYYFKIISVTTVSSAISFILAIRLVRSILISLRNAGESNSGNYVNALGYSAAQNNSGSNVNANGNFTNYNQKNVEKKHILPLD